MATNDFQFWDDLIPDYRTPELLTTPAHSASPSPIPSPDTSHRLDDEPEPADRGQRQGSGRLPLLHRADWQQDWRYDENNPICIHYDFQWRLLRRENKRAKLVCEDIVSSVVLAPSDFWQDNLQQQLNGMLQNKDHFPGAMYACCETKIKISVAGTCGNGLKKDLPHENIDWEPIDTHVEGLGGFFSKGKKISLSVEFFYKEVVDASTAARTTRKRKTRTEDQRAQLDREAGLWARIYKHHRCRAKHCKQGPHCAKDEFGNHHKLNHTHLKAIYGHIKDNMSDGDDPHEIDLDVDIPAAILNDVMYNPEGASVDPSQELKDYRSSTLMHMPSDTWKREWELAAKYATDECLDLDSVLEQPQVIANAMVQAGVKLGTALRFTGNIRKFRKNKRIAL
ncbi:hypothetical protein HJFPF1_13484 [Paramyrothecium foliicola]|nr:hypothetical protein HJFPF1_13484 [Paramyrothecium foliicola]